MTTDEMTVTCKLKERLGKVRIELESLASEHNYDFSHPVVYTKSCELDILIVQYMRAKKRV